MTSRPTTPRIEPLPEEDVPEGARIDMGMGKVLNIFRTLAHHPDLMKRWLVFGNHVMGKSTLSARDREIAILRVGWLCQAPYEWGQHALIAKHCDLDEEEIRRIAEGPDAEGWSPVERALIRAADELNADACISDATWAELAAHYDTKQLIDIVFTVGQYHLVSMALNTLGVQPEPALPPLPEIE